MIGLLTSSGVVIHRSWYRTGSQRFKYCNVAARQFDVAIGAWIVRQFQRVRTNDSNAVTSE